MPRAWVYSLTLEVEILSTYSALFEVLLSPLPRQHHLHQPPFLPARQSRPGSSITLPRADQVLEINIGPLFC